jgi:preflagellin peptidase FlaK
MLTARTMNASDFELIRMMAASSMFGLACYFDIKKREVSDMLWVAYAVVAGVIYVFDFPSSSEGFSIMVSMAATAAVAYGIYRSGLFGGADMLALITFSGIMPLASSTTLLGSNTLAFHSFAPITVLTNGIILSISYLAFNIARNLVDHSKHPSGLFEGFEHESTARKVFAIRVGHRSKNPQYDFPIERVSNGRREFDFALKPAETTEYESRKDVWVTSGIPFLVYFTAGFIVMIFVGDLFAVFFGLL